MESYGKLWKVMESCGMSRNLMEPYGTSWNPVEFHGTSWNRTKHERRLQNVLEHCHKWMDGNSWNFIKPGRIS